MEFQDGRPTMNFEVVNAWIDGKPALVDGGASIDITAPWLGKPIATIRCGGTDLVDRAVRSASAAFLRCRATPLAERIDWLNHGADQIERMVDEFIGISVLDIGKPMRAARFETLRTAAFMRSVAQQASCLGGEVVPLDATRAGAGLLGLTRRVPYGVVAAVTPFNAPANLLMQKLAPALAAGNAVVVKPSLEGTRTALLIAQCLKNAGVPDGLCNIVPGGVPEATALAAHRLVAVVTITGGTAAGEALARVAGAKKFIGELGGNSPNIVLADADLADAAKRIAASGFEAAGQQCISAQRVIVEEAVYDEFLPIFIQEARKLKVGDPALPDTDVGPVINKRAADRIMEMIESAVAEGAKLQTKPDRNNCLIAPTIVTDAAVQSRIVQQEIFGPAVAVLRARNAQDALDLANNCEFGLQGSVFTRSLDAAIRLSQGLNTGSVWINEGSRFRLDNYPFGGVGRSGHGREGARFALEEYTQWKFTGIRLPTAAA
jgi:acyl-CoA reductase-like NAD-dependent aldehyde dehydrogenase